MRRRDFITVLGGIAAWPLAANAQHPTIGFLDIRSFEYGSGFSGLLAQGIGRNWICRWAERCHRISLGEWAVPKVTRLGR
jgi:hypothetical protein